MAASIDWLASCLKKVMNIQHINIAKAHPDVTWRHVFEKLDRDGQSLNIQIRRAIVHAVEVGMLSSGDRLPSSRQLSNMLGVARNTVTAAYQILSDEGVLTSRERSGIFVADRSKAITTRLSAGPCKGDHWSRRFAARPSIYRHFNKPRNWQDYPYPFLYAQFDPAIFPTNHWREATRVTSSVQEISGWASDLIDDDDCDLVEQLRVQVLPKRGIFARPEEVIITIGAQQALSMLIQLFVARKTRVGFEDPGYPDLRNMVHMATDESVILNMDGKGVIPDEAFAACDLAYMTSTHQCPSTSTMPVERCRSLLRAAEDHDVIIIEDDYEADLNLEIANNIPSMKSMDETGRVVYVGTFSKSLAPGLRIGFIVASPEVIEELRVLRRLLMRHPPTNNQRVLATFIGLGHYQQHLQKTSNILTRRAALIARLLPRYLPQCSWQRAPGAKSYWVKLPEGVNCRALEQAAREEGVLIEAGDIFFARQSDGARYFRLGFTAILETHIETGLEILGRLISAMQEERHLPAAQ